jgi:ligand-binding sensor domain-containing protein
MLSKVLIALILGIIPTVTFSQEKVLRFDHITVEDGLSQNTVQGIVQDKYGFMWFGTWEGLCKYDGYKFTIYKTEVGNPRTIHNNLIRNLYKDDKDNIWVSCVDTMISRYNYDTDDFTRFSKKELPKWCLDSLDRSKSIHFTFIKTTNYLWYVYELYNPLSKNLALNQINNLLTQTNCINGKQMIYRFDPFDNRTLNDEFVFNIYLDKDGILWVGTYSGGVNKADTRQKQFYHYNKSSLIDNLIRAICEDKEGNLWVGTHNKGITKIDQENNTFTHFQHDDKKNSIKTNQIRKIYCDRLGYIWIGTKDGLDRYDPTTNHFRHYSFPKKPKMPANWVYWIMEDHNGYLWIGTWGGIGKYDRKNDKFLIYDPLKTLKRNMVRGILEDRHYNLWISTEGGGLTRMRRDSSNGFEEKLIPTHFLHAPYNNNSLIDNRIYAMLEDENGILWLGTSMGLDRFDPIKGTFKHFTSKNFLPDDLIIGLLCDYKGHIWISHKKGLTKIDTKTFAVRNYTKQDGLLGDEFSENAFYRSPKTGKMFFGGVNGINYFFPDSIQENSIPPKIVFTDLQISNKSVSLHEKINGQVILDKPLYLSKEIKLTYLKQSISIEFAALHYTNPKNNKYAYMLEGFDKNWIKTDASKRTAIYSNLAPKNNCFTCLVANMVVQVGNIISINSLYLFCLLSKNSFV